MSKPEKISNYVFAAFARLGEGHYDGEVEKLCPNCGKPKQVWQFIDACNSVCCCAVPCGCVNETSSELDCSTAAGLALIPKRYRDYTFEAWGKERGSAYEYGLQFCSDAKEHFAAGTGFTLKGDPYTGSTYLLACIANRLTSNGWRVFFTTQGAISEALRPHSPMRTEFFQKLHYAQFVVIDDLGAEQKWDLAISEFSKVITDLIQNKIPILSATSFAKEQLYEYYTDKYGKNHITLHLLKYSPLVSYTTNPQPEPEGHQQ